MKILYVMRHAKSSWDHPDLTDHQRPLNKRGRRDAPEMGRRLKARGARPDRIISSDARRALDTAIAIAERLGLERGAVEPKAGLYLATPAAILERVKALDNRWQQVMIVGHNPGQHEFINRFLSPPIPKLPTAGIVELRFEIDGWVRIDPRGLVHVSHDYPKKGFGS